MAQKRKQGTCKCGAEGAIIAFGLCQACYYARPERRAAIRAVTTRHRARNRERIWQAKSKPCADCGQCFPPYVMDFDHVGDKAFNIATAIDKRWSEIQAEIKKCDVVCANCHRIRTYTRLQAVA